jgi:prepilin signal peptidase PulO-like enzyme (type II secretory pathway)
VRFPSHCPQCQHILGGWDLIPLLSWLWQRGKCRYCRAAISIRYPAIELLMGGLTVLIIQHHGISLNGGILVLFTLCLLIMIVADLETGLIPDEIHAGLLPLGIAYHFIHHTGWESVFLGSGLGLGLGLTLHYGYFLLRGRHGLGLGDVKFLGIAGLWLASLHSFAVFLFYSGAVGVVMGIFWKIILRQERFPFGPALALSLFLLTLYPESGNYFWSFLSLLVKL